MKDDAVFFRKCYHFTNDPIKKEENFMKKINVLYFGMSNT